MLQIKAGRIIVQDDGMAISDPTKGCLFIMSSSPPGCSILAWKPRTTTTSAIASINIPNNDDGNTDNFSKEREEEWIFTPGDARIDIVMEKKGEKEEKSNLVFVVSSLNNMKIYFWSQEPNPLTTKQWIFKANRNYLLKQADLVFKELFQSNLLCDLVKRHGPLQVQNQLIKDKSELMEMFESCHFRQAVDFLKEGIESDLFPVMIANFGLESNNDNDNDNEIKGAYNGVDTNDSEKDFSSLTESFLIAIREKIKKEENKKQKS